jgi:hypothetical protein
MSKLIKSLFWLPLKSIKAALMGVVLIRLLIKTNTDAVMSLLSWLRRGFQSPSPQFIKFFVLQKWGGNQTWIETGTYLGDTTAFLSKNCKKVYSIEASEYFATKASNKFSARDNIVIIQGLSEERLPTLLNSLDISEKNDVSFWLDGHYSGGDTFHGLNDTPITQELVTIAENLKYFSSVTVLIDDVRCFNPSISDFAQYPELEFLVEFANSNDLFWTIEHDIFIATNRNKQPVC